MADDSYFFPDDEPALSVPPTAEPSNVEHFATAEQWAAMTFEPIHLDATRFGAHWDQTRGALARTAIALLRFDDRSLTRHFQAQSQPLKQAMNVYGALREEIDYLKTHIEALDMAATRVLCAATRCSEQQRR